MRHALPVSLLTASLTAALGFPVAAQDRGTAERSSQDQRRTPIVGAVEKIGPAVVNISAERLVRRRSGLFEQFFELGPDRRERGYTTESLGSGVITDASGIVITNDHVVSGASRIFVTMSDGRELEAEVLGADADNDLAVLKVEAKGLKAVRLGTTADLMIGETVLAVGNPFGLSNTVTQGIVSAVHRTVRGEARTYSDFIQTDAAINPGNSGGALVNILGELVGINTAIVGGANTIGFAIPIDRVRRIAEDLLRFGEVKPVWLGLRGVTAPSESGRASAHGLGLKIRSVFPDSPAARAGLAPGDLLVSVDGRAIETREDFDTAIASVTVGKPVTIGVKRKDTPRTLTVSATRAPEDLGLLMLRSDIGLVVAKGRGRPLIASVDRDSAADRKGLERGDVILAVNGQKVASPEDINRAVESSWSRSGLVLVVGRGSYAYTLTFGLD